VDLTDDDLHAVQEVLEGRVTLVDVARTYTVARSALVVIAILVAAGKTQLFRREMIDGYQRLVGAMIIESAIPEEERSERHWYYRSERIVAAARKAGLHTSSDRPGNIVTLTPPEVLVNLMDEYPEWPAKARRIYDEAVARIRARYVESKRTAWEDRNR